MRIGFSVKRVNTLLLLFYGSFVSNILSFGNLGSFDSLVNLLHVTIAIFRSKYLYVYKTLIQKVIKDVHHYNAIGHSVRRNVICCNNYFCKRVVCKDGDLFIKYAIAADNFCVFTHFLSVGLLV